MNSNMPFSVENALSFIEINGVVLVWAKGAAARLIDVIAGEDIVGNWWSHPNANAIYNTLSQVQASARVLVCKLVDGKVTLVHRRLWPALARLATRFEPQQIARVIEEHTVSGRHVANRVPFPEWVSPAVLEQASVMDESEAMAFVGRWLPAPPATGKRRRKADQLSTRTTT